MDHMHCEHVYFPYRTLCSRYRKHASVFYCSGPNEKYVSGEEELRAADSWRESEAPAHPHEKPTQSCKHFSVPVTQRGHFLHAALIRNYL